MGSRLPIYDQLAHQSCSRQINDVLHALFIRERDANIGDDKDYALMIVEIQCRVQHRRAIIRELEMFGCHRAVIQPLKYLMLAEQDDLDEIDFLIGRRKASLHRADKKSKILKMLRDYK